LRNYNGAAHCPELRNPVGNRIDLEHWYRAMDRVVSLLL
jgi:hypothetical protein